MYKNISFHSCGITALALMTVLFPQNSDARQPVFEDDKASISLVYENDIFQGTDQNYTNGIRLAVLSSETNTPRWSRWIADHILPLSKEGRKRIGWAIGQNMYTPRDLSTRAPIPDDRPYAGWLYGSVGMVSDTGERLDNVMLTLGMVGPSSYADQTQKFIHRVVDSPRPEGWDNQLHDELGIILTMERKWRSMYEFSPYGLGVDVTPHIGTNLGNINTDASVGATVRFGYDLPADYGPPRIRPSLPGSDFFVPTQELGGYMFVGVEGRGVARNIFLDGNTFEDSPSVDKKYFVGSLQMGIVLTYKDVRLSFTDVMMTKEFDEQEDAEHFGAVTLSYRF